MMRSSRELKTYLLFLTPLILLAAQSQLSPSASAQARSPKQHFVCNIGYTQQECDTDMAVLRKTLAKYPVNMLGEWTWVLVRSQDWKQLLKTLGLNPDTPAFTCLETKTTFIEEALVAKVPGRASELIARWHVGMTELLKTAVEHEMGHALCHSLNEDKANHASKILEQKRALDCQAGL